MIKMLSPILFQISAVGKGICICTYMHATFLVEIVDRFLDQALIFLSTLEGNVELLQS